MTDHAFGQGLLRVGAALMIGFGLVVAMAAAPALQGPARLMIDLLVWPVDGRPAAFSAETRLLAAVVGGVMAGWGATIWALAGAEGTAGAALARRAIVGPAALWFCLDSLGSVVAGAPLNAASNVLFLVLLSLPFLRRPPVAQT
jgi:hypothetical protein